MQASIVRFALVAMLAAAGAGAAAQSAPTAQTAYRGMCDASAALALGPDRFVVADIEGAAAIDQRIYWISSHGLKGKTGDVDLHRRRLFATDIVAGAQGPTDKAVGAPYERLLDDLLADPRFAVLVQAARIKPEKEGGLSIEGLAATADKGLLIGFRNPQPQGKALVVPLRNPAAVIDKGAKPVFGDLIVLDLGGRGVRSMDRVGKELLISAGPYASAAASAVQPAFALYRWSGLAAEAPKLVRSLDMDSGVAVELTHSYCRSDYCGFVSEMRRET